MNSNLLSDLFDSYTKYFEKSLHQKRFTHSGIIPLIEKLKTNKNFVVKSLGFSIEKREIFSVEFGEGETTILLWSQMHGDEPTATMALFDIFNFLSNEDEFDDFKNLLKKKLKLVFVPMLNPDGTEKIVRQNAAWIDLNRDAIRLQSPESIMLMDLVENYKPEFAFNLHDQDYRWSVGSTNKLAAISLLAPVYDEEKSINESRLRAIKLVADLRNNFEKYLPGQIARYKDDFEPRSFGDVIAAKNVSVILIESGRDVNDSNKMFYRKINFLMMVYSFGEIISNNFEKLETAEYFEIPTNGKFMFDLILRNVNLKVNNENCLVDIAINREEVYEGNSRTPYFLSTIMEIGDLSVFYGIEDFDCKELILEEGKIFNKILASIKNIDSEMISSMLKEGYLFVKTEEISSKNKWISFPINVIPNPAWFKSKTRINQPANFVLTKEGKVEKLLINGWLCDLNNFEKVKNGFVY